MNLEILLGFDTITLLADWKSPVGVRLSHTKRRIVGRFKLKHDFGKHTRHMAVTIALLQHARSFVWNQVLCASFCITILHLFTQQNLVLSLLYVP